jgi:UDP:flavonoid glycosyltransferase YjiC (YdhE family)
VNVLVHTADPEHLDATFGLARALAARGHHVAYGVIADLAAAAVARGYRAVVLHAEAAPAGTLAALAAAPTREARDLAELELALAIADDYFTGGVEAALAELAPAVAVVDAASTSPLGFALHRAGVPCLPLATTARFGRPAEPPGHSYGGSGSAVAGAPAADDDAWLASCFHRRPAGVAAPMFVAATAAAYAARFGYPRAGVTFGPGREPTLAAAPALFAAAPAGHAHGDDAIALADDDGLIAPEPAAHADDRPLIVAAPVRDHHLRSDATRCLAAVIDALGARPAWRAVVVPGRHREAVPVAVPPNVTIAEAASWRALLAGASAFVTHGSALALRRAAAARVPVLALRRRWDPLDAALGVAARGLGLELEATLESPAGIAAAITALLARADAHCERLAALDARCRGADACARAVDAVEQLATVAPARAARPPAVRPSAIRSLPAVAAAAVLADHAAWCAARAVTPGPGGGDPAADAALAELERERARQRRTPAGAPREADDRARAYAAALVRVAPHWHAGAGAIALALHPDPRRAAALARVEAALAHVRRMHAEGAAATADHAAAAYGEAIAAFDHDLERRLTAARRAP